ncbi:two-component response regulator [Pseudooceanicola marinus]|uniref:Two-component response regulator n=1 Tax=Pseudooceanicola marinus TaxID=396013 RepID=A0A1X7A7C0_9RHOB|nr:response regulator [Pseudooceanicola marinus]PJE33688.1 response regulator [Pseudooceanicola marinus]SLN71920.1 two-component response regulator [Pseudooceanicola marinus]
MTTVAIVEDEAILALDMADLCEASGCRVLGLAASAQQASVCFVGVEPEILITDMDLAEGSNGVEVVEILRRRWPGIRVIFVTAATSPGKLDLIRSARPARILAKPVCPSELAKALRALAPAST